MHMKVIMEQQKNERHVVNITECDNKMRDLHKELKVRVSLT